MLGTDLQTSLMIVTILVNWLRALISAEVQYPIDNGGDYKTANSVVNGTHGADASGNPQEHRDAEAFATYARGESATILYT